MFSILQLWNKFSERWQAFSKSWNTVFKVRRLKMQHFHGKLPCQKPMLRQIEWEVQNGTITDYLVFWKFCFSLRTSTKTNCPTTYGPITKPTTYEPTTQTSIFILCISAGVFCGCLFPLSILNNGYRLKNCHSLNCLSIVYGSVIDHYTYKNILQMDSKSFNYF